MVKKVFSMCHVKVCLNVIFLLLYAAPAVCIFDVRSVAVTWDPILYEWMKYVPITKRTATPGANSDNSLKVALDQSAVESSSPLKSQGQSF